MMDASIGPTLTRDLAAGASWDAIVVGAGPAGAFAALRLAQAGAKTLLVERKAFPRDKVCGGCVSHRAVALLHDAGLERQLAATPSTPTRAVRLYAAGRQATISIPEGLAIARRDLDALLVDAAIAAGADFFPQTLAEIGAIEGLRRTVLLRSGASGPSATCRASVVLAADGLTLAGLPSELVTENIVAPRSRIGVGAVLCQSELDGAVADSSTRDSSMQNDVTRDDLTRNDLTRDDSSREGPMPPGVGRAPGTPIIRERSPLAIEPEMIHMAIGRQGYVGIVRTGPGRLLVAAALDPALLAAERHPAAAVASVLASIGRSEWADAMSTVYREAAWGGTPPLTRRLRRPVAERLFVLGDAAGYVEPFTGEGIGWALAAAENVVGPALAARRGWSESLETHWLKLHGRSLKRRRRFCHAVTTGLRSNLLVSAAMRLLTIAPGWSAPAIWLWNRPLQVTKSI